MIKNAKTHPISGAQLLMAIRTHSTETSASLWTLSKITWEPRQAWTWEQHGRVCSMPGFTSLTELLMAQWISNLKSTTMVFYKDWCKKNETGFLSIALVIPNWFLQFKVFLKAEWICYKTFFQCFFQKTNRFWDIFKKVWNKNFKKHKNCKKKLQNQERPRINPIF